MTSNDHDDASRSVVTLTSGLHDTRLAADPQELHRRLDSALAAPVERRRDAVADVARMFPGSPAIWASLGELARDDIEAYACFRVGYHRGLDALRKAGWKGSGLLRWSHEENRPFLRCLDGLRRAAAAIGEQEEEERCRLFLRQLDPNWGSGPVDANPRDPAAHGPS